MDKVNTREIPGRKRDLPRDIGREDKLKLTINGKDINYSSENIEVKLEKKGLVARQLKESGYIQIEIGDKLFKIAFKGKSIDVHGPNVDLLVEEIDGNRRRITANSDSQGLHEKTIEMGADNRKDTIGYLTLLHRDNSTLENDALEIEIEADDLKKGEKEKVMFERYGKDRDITIEYGDKNASIEFKMYISGVKNSKKEVDTEKREALKREYEKEYPSAAHHGGLKVVDMIPVLVY